MSRRNNVTLTALFCAFAALFSAVFFWGSGGMMLDQTQQDQTQRRPLISIAQTFFWAVIVLISGLVLIKLADVLVLVFAAALIATILRGAAQKLSHYTKIPPGVSLAIIIVSLLGMTGLILWFRGPALAGEVSQLADQLNGEMKALWTKVAGTSWGKDIASRIHNDGNSIGASALGFLKGFASNTLGVLGSLVVLVVAALYFAISPQLYVQGSLRLMPLSWRDRAMEIYATLALTLRWWFIGQAIDMVVVGGLTTIGLMLLHVPLAATLGLIAALCNFVPYIGAIAGSVPAIIVALSQGSDQALWVAGLFLIVQALEGNLIAPVVQKSTVHLPPVVTIMSQTVLGTLLGPIGLILATPLTAAGMVLVRMIYVEDILGDREMAAHDPKP